MIVRDRTSEAVWEAIARHLPDIAARVQRPDSTSTTGSTVPAEGRLDQLERVVDRAVPIYRAGGCAPIEALRHAAGELGIVDLEPVELRALTLALVRLSLREP